MRYSAAVFDFDGTLVDTREPILASVRHALAAGGHPVPPDAEILRHVGLGLREVLARLAPGRSPAEIERLAAAYRDRFDEVAPGRTRPFDGVPEALVRLRAAGLRLAIATNRGRGSLDRILAAHRLDMLFDARLTAECVPCPKPHPAMLRRILSDFALDPGQVVMVGDTTVDLRMGRAAGVDTCAVTYGAHSPADLLAEGPTHVVHRAADLPEVMGAAR